jgi:hypothetical protein
MGREWELSYRLGMQLNIVNSINTSYLKYEPIMLYFKQWSQIIQCFVSQACPDVIKLTSEKSEESMTFLESGELQKQRRALKGFSLPDSKIFLSLTEKRKKDGQNIYEDYMDRKYRKKKDYQSAVGTINGATSSIYIDRKTNEIVYLEKHRIIPGYEGGNYMESNVVLLKFNEHVMAHYLRFLQYGNFNDSKAVQIMLLNDSQEIRRKIAQIAGQIGGKKAQELLREQGRGWYNSEIQSKLGKKGSSVARSKKVGAFDPQNLLDAVVAWQQKYQNNSSFRNKMQRNLKTGLATQKQQKINIYDPLSQRIRSVNYHGVTINGQRISSPYLSVLNSGKVEYTEERIHLSEDFFWYHVEKSPNGKKY